MAKLFLVLLLAAVAVAKPMGYGGVSEVSHGSHMSSHMISPYGLGFGYGMMGYPGLIGHSISSQSIAHHAMPHYGMYGMGLKGIGMYPGLGMGYGLIG